jgi:hypothetical protein
MMWADPPTAAVRVRLKEGTCGRMLLVVRYSCVWFGLTILYFRDFFSVFWGLQNPFFPSFFLQSTKMKEDCEILQGKVT